MAAHFIISLGVINKKMLFPLVYILVIIIRNIFGLFYLHNEASLFLDGFGFSTGELLVFFLSKIFNYRRTLIKKKKKMPMKQYIKDYSILFFINTFFMFYKLIPFYIVKDNKYENIVLFISDTLEIIFINISLWSYERQK